MGGQEAVFAAAGVLAAVIVGEILAMPRGNPGPLRSVDPAPGQAAPRVRADGMQAWVGPILARPLFSPNRRPAAAPDDGAAGRVPGLPRLSGILVGPFGRSAIFASDTSRPVVLGEGGRIAAYTVRSIDASGVRLDGPQGVQRLQPAFDMVAQAGAAHAGAPQPGAAQPVPAPPAAGHTGQAARAK